MTQSEFEAVYYDKSLTRSEAAQKLGIPQSRIRRVLDEYGLKTRSELGIKSTPKKRKARRDKRLKQVDCPNCKHLKACKALPVTEPVKCEIRWSSDDVPIDTDSGAYVRSVSLGDVVRIS